MEYLQPPRYKLIAPKQTFDGHVFQSSTQEEAEARAKYMFDLSNVLWKVVPFEGSILKPILKLSDMDGNAFFILGRARRVAKEAGWSEERISKFVKEAMDGNYDHLLQTCEKYFDVE